VFSRAMRKVQVLEFHTKASLFLGYFKLMVMFFRLTNLLATFQTIMNKLLRNFVNTEKMVTFSNNITVEIEYNKLVRTTGQNL